MLAKITRANQVTIPREVMKKAHLSQETSYVEVGYEKGIIFLKPVIVQDRIDPEQFEKFQAWATQKAIGDLEFSSLEAGIKRLKKRAKKR